MRKVVASLFIALDGVVEAPERWQFDGFDDEMVKSMVTQIDEIDTVLLGRVTYESWSAYWPTATYEPFASFINNVPKVVVSTTLKQVGWGSFDNAKLMEGSLAEGITRLKEQPGRTIGVNGSPSLVRSLLAQDLLDELYLQVHPVLGGTGQRLFSDDSDVKRLKLLENKTNSKGVAMLHYQARDI